MLILAGLSFWGSVGEHVKSEAWRWYLNLSKPLKFLHGLPWLGGFIAAVLCLTPPASLSAAARTCWVLSSLCFVILQHTQGEETQSRHSQEHCTEDRARSPASVLLSVAPGTVSWPSRLLQGLSSTIKSRSGSIKRDRIARYDCCPDFARAAFKGSNSSQGLGELISSYAGAVAARTQALPSRLFPELKSPMHRMPALQVADERREAMPYRGHLVADRDGRAHDHRRFKRRKTGETNLVSDIHNLHMQVVGEKRCPIVDTRWQTETGAHMIMPLPGGWTQKPGKLPTRIVFGC